MSPGTGRRPHPVRPPLLRPIAAQQRQQVRLDGEVGGQSEEPVRAGRKAAAEREGAEQELTAGEPQASQARNGPAAPVTVS